MRFMALKTLRVQGQDGLMTSITPGQEVPLFASWPAALKSAHLNTGNVRDLERLTPVVEAGRVVMMASVVAPFRAEATEDVESLSGSVKCHLCDHPGFTNQNSFRKHFVRKHAGE